LEACVGTQSIEEDKQSDIDMHAGKAKRWKAAEFLLDVLDSKGGQLQRRPESYVEDAACGLHYYWR
jgi:hypothetical protein